MGNIYAYMQIQYVFIYDLNNQIVSTSDNQIRTLRASGQQTNTTTHGHS